MSLEPRQRRFVTEYLVDLNAKQAAIRAGYSTKTAESQGSRLLSNLKVREAIESAQNKRAVRVEVKADDVLLELIRLAKSDVRQLFDADGNLRPVQELSDEAAAAVASIEVVTKNLGRDADGNREVEYIHKIRCWDKPAALVTLAKHLGLLKDRVVHENPDGSAVQFYLPANGRG